MAKRFTILVDGEVVKRGDDAQAMRLAYRRIIDKNLFSECAMWDEQAHRRILHTDPEGTYSS